MHSYYNVVKNLIGIILCIILIILTIHFLLQIVDYVRMQHVGVYREAGYYRNSLIQDSSGRIWAIEQDIEEEDQLLIKVIDNEIKGIYARIG